MLGRYDVRDQEFSTAASVERCSSCVHRDEHRSTEAAHQTYKEMPRLVITLFPLCRKTIAIKKIARQA